MFIVVCWMPQKPLTEFITEPFFQSIIDEMYTHCFIRLVLDSYIRQNACALWNSVKSRYLITMSNGL